MLMSVAVVLNVAARGDSRALRPALPNLLTARYCAGGCAIVFAMISGSFVALLTVLPREP